MKISSTVLSLSAAIALSGCATSTDYGSGKTWDGGWRKATVSSVKDELSWHQRADCGKVVSTGDKIVSVRYRSGQTRWKFIPMPAKEAPAPEAKVLVNVYTCEVVLDR